LSDLDRCTRCGLCEQACPTYRLDQHEPDSPRGRVFLMKEVAEGRASVDANLAEHLYRCLGCRACETACPSGVPFGTLLEAGRLQVEMHGELDASRRGWRRFRRLAFEQILPTPWLFHAAMAPARLLQSIPALLALVRALPLPRHVRTLVHMIPDAAGAVVARPGAVIAAQGERRARVGLFSGCVMNSLFGHVHDATARVLARNGCEVVVVEDQWCCGALNLHAGERTHALTMARRNVDAFSKAALDAIIVNSAGCGAVLKNYGELLHGDVAAVGFSQRVYDVTEFLSKLGLRPGLGNLATRATYQDACHLAHAQAIRRAPRELLEQIPGIEFVEMKSPDRCCGAAGVYSLTQPLYSQRILAEKLDDIEATGAKAVVTTNPGCAMQIQSGLARRRSEARVYHLIELLDQSYRSGP
jgi:glycolate dehydrogenase iron-sulfur subunit